MSLILVMLFLLLSSEAGVAATLGLEEPNTKTGWFVCAARAEITIYMRIPSVDMNEETQTEAPGETEETIEAEETNVIEETNEAKETNETEETGEIENHGETGEMENLGETEEAENPGETRGISTQG